MYACVFIIENEKLISGMEWEMGILPIAGKKRFWSWESGPTSSLWLDAWFRRTFVSGGSIETII